jgi:hypothetical protein
LCYIFKNGKNVLHKKSYSIFFRQKFLNMSDNKYTWEIRQ